jgi:hypothetical protein
LFQGIRWGIGDGHSVKILKDNRIPRFPPEILEPISPILVSAIVHCLIDDETGTWNAENVYAFFAQEVAAEIMQVPISRHTVEDFACWPHTKHGTFTVRSAYNLARSKKFFRVHSKPNRGLSSTWVQQEKDQKAVWKIKTPGKINIYLWRFA